MPKTCPQCQSEAADDATFCPSCGAQMSAGAPTAQAATMGAPAGGAAAASAPPPAAASGSSIPAYKFDVARWSLADRIAGGATILLFISLFLSWFSYNTGVVILSVSGVSAHGYLYISMILCIAIVVYLVLRAGWDEIPINANIPHLTVMIVATIINFVLVLIAFLDKPGFSGVGWAFGAVLALIVSIVAAAPYTIPQLRAKTMS